MKNKIVGGTGFTGSLGVHLTKRLLKEGVKKVVVISRDEYKQRQQMAEFNDKRIEYKVCDIRDGGALAFATRGLDILIHAAALKHVPTGEEQPFETIKTNVIGTMNVIQAAGRNRINKCLLISTDKGCHPINLYGATKLCGEKMFIAANQNSGTIFSCVRYGNVIGSRGSIIETILKNNPKELVITDPKMTRFWFNLDGAVDIVFKALTDMKGGEIFVPKISSMLVMDMFKILAPETKLYITGMRPGEKVHECLVNGDEMAHTTEYENYFVIQPELFGVEYQDKQTAYTSANAPKLNKEEFLKLVYE
jgi:UDP-N-acetylglucosamine 4,6-dehydratase/5-epimerase